MRWLPVICYLAIGIWQFIAHYDEILPGDPGKRQAQQRCFMADHRFDPLDPAARDKCYKEFAAYIAHRARASCAPGSVRYNGACYRARPPRGAVPSQPPPIFGISTISLSGLSGVR